MTHIARPSTLLAFVGALVAGCHRAPEPSMQPGAVVAPVPGQTDRIIDDSVRHVLDRALADSAFPGATAVVGTRSRIIAQYSVGHLDWSPSPVPDAHTMWDLASLTKVVGLTSGVMQLVGERAIDLDAPVQRYLPNWTGPNKERVTIRHLLTHTSGLPSFKPYDEITHDADSLAKLMFATELDTLPGTRMVYSDIGAYMMGRVLEKVSGQSLDAYVREKVFARAGMRESMYNPPASLLPRIAPTEIDPRRGGLVRGKVHDERAYYLNGVSAHAGIFSTAADLARFAQMYLNDGIIDGTRVLPAEEIKRFSAYADSTFANRGIGWQKPDLPGMRFATPSAAWAGRLMSTRAFGHTGFTGTSIAIDPVNDVFIVLLSNRVNPTRNNNKITAVRRQLADAVMSTVLHSNPPRP